MVWQISLIDQYANPPRRGERAVVVAAIHDGLKPALALVRVDVSPPSIRWREASLILHARYAAINHRKHAPSRESVA